MKSTFLILLGIIITVVVKAQPVQNFEFNAENWDLPENYQIIEFQGKQSLLIQRSADDSSKGYYATVKQFNFKDGVIEFDMFCPEEDSSYVGFLFRLTNHKEEDRYELFYFRPFQTNEIGAVQYMPVNNGAINWPDYNHDVYKSDGEIPRNEWIHVKADIKDPLATVYINDQEVMNVPNLARGRTIGKVGLWIGNTPECYFSNFSMTVDSSLSGYSKDGKRVYASSEEWDGVPVGYAFDKNGGTRWSSEYSDPQWIMIDLGEIQKVGGVILKWEAACAKAYEIRVSQDSLEWTTVFSTTEGNGGTNKIAFDQVDARYVMMYGTTRATIYGYSLYEFELYENLPSTIPDNIVTDNFTMIYPNPTVNNITISIKDYNGEILTALITNSSGQTINKKLINSNLTTINTLNMSKGMYILSIEDKNGNSISSNKIIKE